MSNISEEISELITSSGKAAPDMTKALKIIGDGDMQRGIKNLADYCMATGQERGHAVGTRNGTIIGSLTTLLALTVIGGCFYIKNKLVVRRQKELDAEGTKILNAIKDSVPAQDLCEESTPSIHEENEEAPGTDAAQKG